MTFVISIIAFAVTFLVFVIASFEDIKKKEVYDFINYSYLFLILLLSIIASVLTNDFTTFKFVLFGMLFGFIIGSILFFLGVWGGGDSKLLTAFGASSYFLINLFNYSLSTKILIFSSKIRYWFGLLISILKKYILILDSVIIVLLLFLILKDFYLLILGFKNSKDRSQCVKIKRIIKNRLIGLNIIFIFLIGILLNYSTLYLAVFGAIILFIIHFCDEEALYPIYIRLKKKISKLTQNDVVDEDLIINKNFKETVKVSDLSKESLKKVNSKVLISKDSVNPILGLGLEKLSVIEEAIKKKMLSPDLKIFVRFYFPFSALVFLNLILYLIKIISLNETNLKLIMFLLEYISLTIVVGGIFAILLILFYVIKHFKKIFEKFFLTKYEILSFLFFFFFVIIISLFYSKEFFLLLNLIWIYIFVKVTRSVEKYIFIKKRDVNKLVPGDWIVENIYCKGKKIYDVKEFVLGVSEEQISRIKELSKIDNSLKSVSVKDGIAFIPIMFVGMLLLLFLI